MDLNLLIKINSTVTDILSRSDKTPDKQEIFNTYEYVCIAILDSTDEDEQEMQDKLSVILAMKARELGIGYDEN